MDSPLRAATLSRRSGPVRSQAHSLLVQTQAALASSAKKKLPGGRRESREWTPLCGAAYAVPSIGAFRAQARFTSRPDASCACFIGKKKAPERELVCCR